MGSKGCSTGAFALWVVGVLGCQDGYPIAPTRCDQFCHVSEPAVCPYVDPAECVIACESQLDLPDVPSCRGAWSDVLDCLTALPDDQKCWIQPLGAEDVCSAEGGVYLRCLAANSAPSEG